MGKYKTYSKEFKLEAVRLLEKSGKPGAEIARELGIKRNQLYKWQEQLTTKGHAGVFPGHGRRAGREAELARLERENEKKGPGSIFPVLCVRRDANKIKN